jgi:hypothetical protein
MIFLVKCCPAEISGQQHYDDGPFCTLFQSDLIRLLNIKNAS